MKKFLFLTKYLLVFLFPAVLCARINPTDSVNNPTAYTPQRAEYEIYFQIYDQGGLLTKGRFGFTSRLALGLSLNIEGMIGSGEMKTSSPEILAKLKILEEGKNFPALSLGYDATAYKGIKGKGVYLVASKEFPLGNLLLHLHGGLNLSRDITVPGAFASADLSLTPELSLMIEGESIYTNEKPSRADASYNFGIQYSPTFNLKINVFLKKSTQAALAREVRIEYRDSFL